MDTSVLAAYKEELRQVTANYKDAEMRHDNLLAEYRQLASGFLSLQAENARLVADNASLSATLAATPALGQAELLMLGFARSRPAMFLRRSVCRIRQRVGKSV